MIRRRPSLPALLSFAAFAVAFTFVTRLVPEMPGNEDLPEFTREDVDARKRAFFDYLRPVVRYYNARVLAQREWLLAARKLPSLGWFDRRRLERLAAKYHVDMETAGVGETIESLLRRVDAVPDALVLVQAAMESGWGSSRFAREGNALFGERCFDAGCGIVPDGRGRGQRFEVESFQTVGESVESYIRNLNTHERYVALRRARQQLREREAEVTGVALAGYLDDYSELGPAYVAEIRSMILYNDLE